MFRVDYFDNQIDGTRRRGCGLTLSPTTKIVELRNVPLRPVVPSCNKKS